MLFSEFVFDLPIPLPETLTLVPVAKQSAKSLVIEICKSIRNNKTLEELYVAMAEKVATELDLPAIFKNENNLGEIITFSFEDNTYFFHCIALLLQSDITEAHSIIKKSNENIWLRYDEEKRQYWKLAELGCKILNLSRNPPQIIFNLKNIIDLYTTELYKIDQLQRKFEKQLMEVLQPNNALQQLVRLVRNSYNTFTEKPQNPKTPKPQLIELINEQIRTPCE